MAISRGEAAGSPGGQILLAQLRRCHMLRNEMHHFSTNLHHYVMFEARSAACAAPIDSSRLIAPARAYRRALRCPAVGRGNRDALLRRDSAALLTLLLAADATGAGGWLGGLPG